LKHFAKKLVLFAAILVVILWGVDRWLDRESSPHTRLQYDEAFYPKSPADLIIVGASHATHGINPRYLEREDLTVYNFALNGAGPSFTLKWYKAVFRRYHQKPKYVIYAVHWVMFDPERLLREFEHDSHYFPLSFFIEEMRDVRTLKSLLLNRFAFTRERKQLVPRLARKKDPEVYPKTKFYNGFIPFNTKRDLKTKDVVLLRKSDASVRAFEELLDEFKKDGIRVVLVQIPGYIPGREAPNLSEGAGVLKSIAAARAIPFLDYDTERVTGINYNPEFFSDWGHLNERGSEAFSKLLRRDLDGFLNQNKP
jgi:hypothetical protein